MKRGTLGPTDPGTARDVFTIVVDRRDGRRYLTITGCASTFTMPVDPEDDAILVANVGELVKSIIDDVGRLVSDALLDTTAVVQGQGGVLVGVAAVAASPEAAPAALSATEAPPPAPPPPAHPSPCPCGHPDCQLSGHQVPDQVPDPDAFRPYHAIVDGVLVIVVPSKLRLV